MRNRNHLRRIIALSISSTLLTSALLMPAASASEQDSKKIDKTLGWLQRNYPDLKKVATGDGTKLVTGSLPEGIREAGQPVMALVSTVNEAEMKEGDSWGLTVIGAGVSDSKGTYEIFSQDLDDLAQARNPETGRSDVTIIFPTLPDSSSELASIEVSSTATAVGAQRSVSGATSRAHKVKAVDLRKQSKAVEAPEALAAADISTPQTLSKPNALAKASSNDFGLSAAEQRLVDNITPPTTNRPCSVILLKDLGKRTTRVGQVWSKNSRAKVAFTYTSDASRGVTLGVGVTSKNGSSSAGKSVVKNFSSTTPYTAVTGAVSKGYNKNTTYHKKYYYCVAWVSTREVKIEPAGMSGSSVVTLKQSDAPNPSASKCDWYYNGALIVDRGNNTQFTNGVSLKAVIGIDLAVQSGYHSGTKVAVNATSGGLTICGNFGLPEAASTGDIIIK